MKRLFNVSIVFLTSILLFGMIFTISCKKENQEEEKKAFPPTLLVISPDTTTIIVSPGEEINISVIGTSNKESGVKLTSLKITRNFEENGDVIVLDTSMFELYFALYDYMVKAPSSNGTELWTITVTDAAGEMAAFSFDCIVEGSQVVFLGDSDSITMKECKKQETKLIESDAIDIIDQRTVLVANA